MFIMEQTPLVKESFHDTLKKKADLFGYSVYRATKNFPKEEVYGLTSQLRRAALSVVLNYIEGYARNGEKQYSHFLQISYGSLKEAKYLIFFASREGYMDEEKYRELTDLAEELGAMLWKTQKGIREK